jgi:hypothetical protein
MVSTGTATDAATTAAVTSAARALIITSAMILSFISWVDLSKETNSLLKFVTLSKCYQDNGANSNTKVNKGNTILVNFLQTQGSVRG